MDENEMVDRRRAEEAALLADHHARLAALPGVPDVPPAASDAFLRRHAQLSATRAAGVQASCRAFAEGVRAMRAAHEAAEGDLRAALAAPAPAPVNGKKGAN